MAYIVNGIRVAGYDNERGRGDRCQLDGNAHPYLFVKVER